jgi:hypothetical protein
MTTLSSLPTDNCFCALLKPEAKLLTTEKPILCEPMQLFGVSKNIMRSQLLNSWNFEKELRTNPAIAYYRQLEVTSEWFFSRVSEGTITRDGITFIVIYHQTTRYHCKYVSRKLQLSFRKPHRTYGLEAYVLVRPL